MILDISRLGSEIHIYFYLLLLFIYLTSVVICSNANLDRRLRGSGYLVLPFVPTRISRSIRQPQGLMNELFD